MKEWVFHVKHNARPETVVEVLLILADNDNIDLDQILSIGTSRGYIVGTTAKSPQSVKENPIQLARDLKLVDSDHYKLTPEGYDLVKLFAVKPKTVYEYLHFLNYSTWNPKVPQNNCFSWTYRNLCNNLWDASYLEIDRSQLADLLANTARTQFGVDNVSLSERSAEGVIKWLRQLDPPVIVEGQGASRKVNIFSRRAFCSPESFIFAVDYLYTTSRIGYQTNIILDISKQEEICKTCLLELSGFDNAMEWACGQYNFIEYGYSGGWGKYLVLSRPPSLVDFLG